ncbi:HAD family hydrolase [Luteolibacter sp. Y139]|uniref:HAD family hydrolase n=1 Tax=Luteolibacter soli TaxID=3135280 RepID=A0ABU9B0T1_9BACT
MRFGFPIRAVAFDLDDTLFDRRMALARLLDEWSSSAVNPEDAWKVDQDGQAPREEFFGWLASRFGGPGGNGPSSARHFQRAFPLHVTPDPAVLHVLDRLRESGLPLGLLSNGSPGMQMAKLRACGAAGYFDKCCRLFSGGIQLEKPDPRAFLLLASRLDCRPGEILFVGDDPVRDIAGAAAAGMMTCRLKRPGRTGDCEGATIESMAELPMLLAAHA